MAKAKATKYRFRTKFYRYKGISAAEAKGPDPDSIYVGKLCPGGLLWPSDIHLFYETMKRIKGRLAAI